MPSEGAETDVERAFREWCALVGLPSIPGAKAGSFRLVRDGPDRIHIEQVAAADGGEARLIAEGMTGREFCEAVRFVHESFNIKTVQVARTLSRRRRPRP